MLPNLPDGSAHCVVTSPPYWGLRDYGVGGQIGLEATPGEYVEVMVAVFREVRRVLRDDGTVWVNLGDSYTSGGRDTYGLFCRPETKQASHMAIKQAPRSPQPKGLKPKDMIGIPWRVAFALQADGWYLRQDIIWSKPNPMPESVRDRCTKAHEYIFLLSKSERYFYDADAIAQPTNGRELFGNSRSKGDCEQRKDNGRRVMEPNWSRNKRSVWEVATAPFSEAHFATFPPALIEPCILAGCPKDGMVLDPFGGAGTTGLVADRLERNAILIELNADYAKMAERRIADDAGMFTQISVAP
jgi:DNA modification methylase